MNVTRNLDIPGIPKFSQSRRQTCFLTRPSITNNEHIGNLTTIMSDSETNSSENNLESWHDWIGQRVCISGIKCGILRYFGDTEFSTGTWCGVELDEPVGKNNGTVRGVEYFVCEDKYGIFAPLSKTAKILDDSQIQPARNAAKSKLPSPKIKQETICDNATIDFNKTIHYNMNNEDVNAVGDMFKKLRKPSGPMGANKKFGFGHTNNNDSAAARNKLMERRSIASFRTNFSGSVSEDVNDNEVDPLNRTITLEDNKQISFRGQNANLDTTTMFPTIDSANSKFEIMNVQDRRDSTFILNISTRRSIDDLEVFNEQFGSHEDLLSFDCDESLGILSPGEMKDFSSSFENTFVSLHPYRSSIPKNMSCDDVKEMPEFEIQNTGLSSHSTPAVPPLEGANSQFFSRNATLNLENQTHGESASHIMHSSPDEVPQSEELCNQAKTHQKSPSSESVTRFGLSDGLDYNCFSSSCDKRAFNSSLHSGNHYNNEQGTLLVDINVQEATLCNADDTICLRATEKGTEKSEPDQSFNQLNIQDHLRPIVNHNLGKFSVGNSFTDINDETLPNAVLSFSELEAERQNSVSLSRPSLGSQQNLSGNQHLLVNLSLTNNPMPKNVELFSKDAVKGIESEQNAIAQSVLDSSNVRESSNIANEVDVKNITSEAILDINMETNMNFLATDSSQLVITPSVASEVYIENKLSIEQISENGSALKEIENDYSVIKDSSLLVASKMQINLDLLTSSPMQQYSDLDDLQIIKPPVGENITSSCLNQTTVIQVGKLVDLSGSSENDQLNKTQVIGVKSPADTGENVSLPYQNSEQVKVVPKDEVKMKAFVPPLESFNDEPIIQMQCSDEVEPKQFDSTFNLNKTFDKGTLPEAIMAEEAQADGSMPFASPNYNNNISIDEFSPLFGKGIEDISCISPDFSGIICDLSDDPFNATVCISSRRDTTFEIRPNEKGKHIPLQGRKSMFPSISMSKVRQSTPIQSNRTNRKSLTSKVKEMELSKPVSSKNQENMNATRIVSTQKKPGRWDAITSKISAGLTENKSPKPKKDIVSKVNTNLDIARHSTPKTSPGTTTKFRKSIGDALVNESKDKILKKSTVQNMKTKEDNVESRVLTQLQNVDPSKQTEFKVPVGIARRKTGLLGKVASQLPSPTESTGTTNSMPAKLGVNSRKSIVPKNQTAAPSKKQEFVVPAGVPPKIMGRPSIGKAKEPSTKDVKPSRWSTGSLPKTPITKQEPRKFVSKTELVREIQELGATCENRTKELNLLKIMLRDVTKGFEAFVVLNKYMIDEYDPFSQPRLQNEYNRVKDKLYHAGEQLQACRQQLDELQTVHADELMELTEKLGMVHEDEISEIKSRHADELAEVDSHHKHRVRKLKEAFRKEAEENEEQNILTIKELQEQYEIQKLELEESHSKRLADMRSTHDSEQFQLQTQIGSLHSQYSALQVQLRQAEAVFMRDKNAKIQYMSSKKNELEKEVDSLKTVLEIKTTQIQDLHKENFKIKKQLEELPAAREKIRNLELKTEDLKANMHEKMKLHRELSSENQQLVIVCEKEAKVNSRLSQANEELQWKLQQSMESSLRSSSLCASPDLWSREDDQRSSSRMSLPILQSERVRSLTDSPVHASFMSRMEDHSTPRPHSMSMSWHPALPTHAESPLAPEASTPLRSSSARGARFNPIPQSKLSILKLKKDIEAEMLRRNSSFGQKLPTSRPRSANTSAMSMSWGGETFADYYDEIDESCVQICAEQQSGQTRKFFIKYENERKKGRKSKQLAEALPEQDLEMNADKSLSGVASLQSSYYSSSDSCSSYLPTQPGSEESNSHSSESSGGEKSQDPNPFVSSTVKPPRELAGESMVQEMEMLARALLQESGHFKAGNGSCITDVSSSSPDDGKDNGANVASMTTPSIETSSQGMADSTNLDVSWGDEEMPSEND